MLVESKKLQIFNLMDTNGRRKDVVNALQLYLQIIDEIQKELGSDYSWASFPNSIVQYKFYEKAVQYSPEVFKQHNNYDWFIGRINNDEQVKYSFYNQDLSRLKSLLGDEFDRFEKVLDKDIESRARHYTSTLVKLGLVDNNRIITEVGKSILNNKPVERDGLEKILPIDNINLLYLRQLMKLRIFSKEDEKSFYAPMMKTFDLLLNNDGPVSIEEFKKNIQNQIPGITSNDQIEYITTNGELPDIFFKDDIIDEEQFHHFFRNGKSKSNSIKYYKFYILLHGFNFNRTKDNLSNMIDYYKINKMQINKAFGYGKNIFNLDECDNVDKFLDNNDIDIFKDQFNFTFYSRFLKSKQFDKITEYSDTTTRIMKITGIVKFKNGLVELAYKDIFKEIFKNIRIESYVFGQLDNMELSKYEGNTNSIMSSNISISSILGLDGDDVNSIINSIQNHYNCHSSSELGVILSNSRQREFELHIKEKYPLEEVVDILKRIPDRKNDAYIKNKVNPSATIPTIYEYIIAIAWYYFSGEDFDILNSINMSLNADYEPETHAGGGVGDIVIEYADRVVMLEVTLMNKNAQKRGEWEPVMRHSINLKSEKEPKEVITFFIADELDLNTINIWRAVSSVPLQATNNPSKITSNVVIMPLKNSELVSFIENKKSSRDLENKARQSFGNTICEFDMEWRDKICKSI